MAKDAFGNYIPGLTDDTGYVTPQNGQGVQTGAGAPGVSTPISIIYVDSNTGATYSNPTQTAGGWILVGGGDGNGVQLVVYTSGTPANPPDLTKPALAYDPNGIQPILGWGTVSKTWGAS